MQFIKKKIRLCIHPDNTVFGNFSIKEILIVLLLLQNKPHGRYELSRLLGMSITRARAILEQLNNMDLIISRTGRAGSILSSKGADLILDINRYVLLNFEQSVFVNPPSLDINDNMVGILIRSDEKQLSGLIERDIAVREGALGAVTLVNNHIWLVPPDMPISIKLKKYCEYNIISLVFGDPSSLFMACSAIACYHIEQQLITVFNHFFNN